MHRAKAEAASAQPSQPRARDRADRTTGASVEDFFRPTPIGAVTFSSLNEGDQDFRS